MSNDNKFQIIIPCYNEEGNIQKLITEIDNILLSTKYIYEYVFIDDGSTDNTYDVINDISKIRDDIVLIKLSRNFGKEAAIAAGLNNCNADAVIIIDSDLQHPPHLIPAMITEWENGVNIVDAVKHKRQKENFIVRVLSLFFNKIMCVLTGMDFKGASDYKLLDKSAIAVLNSIEEKNRFFRGLTNWIGLRHSKIEYQVQERKSGTSKWNWIKLFQLSIDAITSYSSKPLHIVTFLGIFTFLFSIILGLQTLYNWLFGHAVSGFTTVILVVLIFFSIIMLSMGILGIYISKLYNEVKNRPIFVIEAQNFKLKNEK